MDIVKESLPVVLLSSTPEIAGYQIVEHLDFLYLVIETSNVLQDIKNMAIERGANAVVGLTFAYIVNHNGWPKTIVYGNFVRAEKISVPDHDRHMEQIRQAGLRSRVLYDDLVD